MGEGAETAVVEAAKALSAIGLNHVQNQQAMGAQGIRVLLAAMACNVPSLDVRASSLQPKAYTPQPKAYTPKPNPYTLQPTSLDSKA